MNLHHSHALSQNGGSARPQSRAPAPHVSVNPKLSPASLAGSTRCSCPGGRSSSSLRLESLHQRGVSPFCRRLVPASSQTGTPSILPQWGCSELTRFIATLFLQIWVYLLT